MVRLSGVGETVKESGWQGRNASGLEIESWKGSWDLYNMICESIRNTDTASRRDEQVGGRP